MTDITGSEAIALRSDEASTAGRALVAGCAGMIGARVAERLLAQGVPVVGVDDLNESYDARLKHWRMNRLIGEPDFDFHRGDIADANIVKRLFARYSASGGAPFSAVVNLAARAGVRQSVQEPAAYFRTNLTGTLNLLQSCVECGIPKFALASTSSVYSQTSEAIPLSEEMATSCPLSPYAASKKAAEVLTYTYHHLYGLDASVLRYFTVYGPAGRPDMSPFRFVQKIAEGRPITVYGDGLQSRDFTFVEDVAEATLLALKPMGYQTINVGAGSPIALRDAITIIEFATGRKAEIDYQPRHPSDVAATWADIGKARRLLGWTPRVSFEEGVERLVKWYRENRDWAMDIATSDAPGGKA